MGKSLITIWKWIEYRSHIIISHLSNIPSSATEGSNKMLLFQWSETKLYWIWDVYETFYNQDNQEYVQFN